MNLTGTYNMISNNVVVSLLGEELDRKASDISNGISTALLTTGSTETEENRRLLADAIEKFGGCEVGDVIHDFEFSPSSSSFGVNDSYVMSAKAQD
jgi:hypothetical protein